VLIVGTVGPMRAAQLTRLEGPSSITIADLPAPAAEPGHVLIDVHRAGVTFPETLLSRGQYQLKPELPFIPGSEVSGVVREDPTGTYAPGQRVAAFPGLGGFAECVAAPLPTVFPLPDWMDLETAAALPMNYLTCLFALEHRGAVRSGETVLVHGASGGIGTASIQLAKALGARVVAVVSTTERGDTARRAGADEVVLADGFKDAVRDLTDGRGVDVVVDPVGGDRFTDSLRSLATEGRLLVIGFTGGSIPEVRVNRLLLNNISVVGVGWGAFWLPQPGYLQQQWNRLMELWDTGYLVPAIGSVVDLDEAASAVAALEDRTALGKVLLRVRD
jgi:NADPH:quinone reductase